MDSWRHLRYGEVWQAELDPVVGHEQAGNRPVVIVSANDFNRSSSRLVFVVPVTRRERRNPFHGSISPAPGGLRHQGFALCEMIRSNSTERLRYRIGSIDRSAIVEIGDRLRVLLGHS